jgi:hypothetical protein
MDDDADGLTDCQDPDCDRVPPCLKLAPAASASTLPLLIVMLGLIGMIGLLRAARLS